MSVQEGAAVRLSAAGSFDPDDGSPLLLDQQVVAEPLRFSWACAVVAAGGDVELDGQQQQCLSAPPAGAAASGSGGAEANPVAFAPGSPDQTLSLRGAPPPGLTYRVSVAVSRGERTSAASVLVTVVRPEEASSPPPDPLVVSVSRPSGTDPSGDTDPSAQVVLLGTVRGQPPPARTWWVLAAGPVPLNLSSPAVAATPPNSSSLVLLPGALTAPGVYTLRLCAQRAQSPLVAFAEAALAVPGAPRGLFSSLGFLSVTPSAGAALDTQFTVRTGAWAEAPADRPPLSFQLVARFPGGGGTSGGGAAGAASSAPFVVRTFRPGKAFTVTLPGGLPEGNSTVVLQLFARNAAGVVTPVPVESEPITVRWAAADAGGGGGATDGGGGDGGAAGAAVVAKVSDAALTALTVC